LSELAFENRRNVRYIAFYSPTIERALAHGDTDPVRAAYHRGAHWKKRVKMAQWWSDHLDELRAQARVRRRD